MKKRSRISSGVIPAAIALTGIMILVGSIIYSKSVNDAKSDFRPKAEEGKATTPSASPNSINTTQAPIPSSSSTQKSANNDVTIVSPKQGETIKSGSRVTGTATLGQGQLYYRVKGGKSGQLALGPVPVQGDKSIERPYSFDIAFTNQVFGSSDQGVLEVYIVNSAGSVTSVATLIINIEG